MRLQHPLSAIGLGVLTWLIPFAVGMVMFPVWQSDRPLFESVIAVVLTGTAVLSAYLYVRRLTAFSMQEAIFIGILWVVLSVLLDIPFFIFGPAQMSVGSYLKDIGVSYLSIPLIAVGITALRKKP